MYFLTWTTRGTWLHGDERGSVDRDHNTRGSPLLPPDLHLKLSTQERLVRDPVRLSVSQRSIASDAIERVCKHRNWSLLAMNIRSNHVHIVIEAPDSKPEIVMGQLKSWATRDLREAGEIASKGRIWTNQGSTRWIKDGASLTAAIDYVLNHQ